MSELPSELARLVAAERETMVPSAAARARNLEGLRAALAEGRPPIVEAPPPPSPPSPGPAGSGIAWVVGAAVLGGLVLAGALWFGTRSGGDGAEPSSPVAAVEPMPAGAAHDAPSSGEVPSSPSASPTSASPTSASPSTGTAPTDRPTEPEVLGSSTETGRGASRPPRKHDAPKTSGAEGDESKKAADDGFAAELRLLKQAKAAADGGRLEEALRLLDRAASRFGTGAFDEERRALRVRVLCALGRAEAGRAEAARFFRDYPASPQTERVRHACD